MKILLNGQERALNPPLTVAALLAELGLADKRVAVEVNRQIVPRSRHGEVELQDNDRVEVVVAIGGG
jgi:sulfur carrier protein